MKTLKNVLLINIFSISTTFAATSPGILKVLQDAVNNDPTYQEQVASYQAIEESVPEARSALLPQLSLNSAIARERDQTDKNGASSLTTTNLGLDISQTIFNMSAFKQLSQSKKMVQASAMQLSADQQDLMVRVAQAYYNVLSKQEILDDAKSQLTFIKNQYEATSERFKHKEATITELNQAKGSYQVWQSQVTTAKLDFYNAKQVLYEMTSKEYSNFKGINHIFKLVSPNPMLISDWVKRAQGNNLSLRAAQLDTYAAQTAIDVKRGDYYPKVSLNAGYDTGRTPTTNTQNQLVTQHENSASVGLNMSWSLYQGGMTNAQVDAAIARLNQSTAAMRKAYLETTSQAKQAYSDILLGIERIKEDRAGVKSNTAALNNAEEGYLAGEQTITEVLQIQTQLYQSQQRLANDTYAYLLDILKLQRSIGSLSIKNLKAQDFL